MVIKKKLKEARAAAGSKGGKAAARKLKKLLTNEERSELARKMVNARWAKLRAAGKIAQEPLRPVELRFRRKG